MTFENKRIWKNALILSGCCWLGFTLFMLVIALLAEEGLEFVGISSMVCLLIVVGGMSLGIAIGLAIANKRYKKDSEGMMYQLDDEIEGKQPIAGSRNFFSTPHWLVYEPFLSYSAIISSTVTDVQVSPYSSTLSSLVIQAGGQKKTYAVASNQASAIKNGIMQWLNPNGVMDDQFSADQQQQESRRQQVEQAGGYSGKQWVNLAVITIVAGLVCFGLYYFISLARGRNVTQTALEQQVDKTIQQMETATDYKTYKKALSLVERDNYDEVSLSTGSIYGQNKLSFILFNDSDYFFNGQIDVLANDSVVGSDLYFLMVPPHSYREVVATVSEEPDQWQVVEYNWYDFDYNKPEFEYVSYQSYDDSYEYYEMFAASLADNTLDNIKSIAQRYYAISMMSDEDIDVYMIDSDSNDLIEYDTYYEYDLAAVSYKGDIDTAGKMITIYSMADGQLTVAETIAMN